MELRNKHVAHSVNDMEESRAIVLWEKKGHRYEVANVAHVHMRSGGLSQRDFNRMMEVTDWLLEQVRARALALPEAEQRDSHGAPGWHSGGKSGKWVAG